MAEKIYYQLIFTFGLKKHKKFQPEGNIFFLKENCKPVKIGA